MANVTILMGVLLIVGIIVMIVAIFLQIALSRVENKWPGLVLPGVTFLFSLLPVLNVVSYDRIWETIATIFMVLLISNIPTVVLLLIYWACRGKYRKKSEIDRMNIDDL